jgi:hypothetical protein
MLAKDRGKLGDQIERKKGVLKTILVMLIGASIRQVKRLSHLTDGDICLSSQLLQAPRGGGNRQWREPIRPKTEAQLFFLYSARKPCYSGMAAILAARDRSRVSRRS